MSLVLSFERLILIYLLGFLAITTATQYYVDPTQNGTCAQNSPCSSISSAFLLVRDGDIINLAVGNYQSKGNSELSTSYSITIQGAGIDATKLDLQGHFFLIHRKSLTLNDLTVQNALGRKDSPPALGGAISSIAANLNVNRVKFFNNTTPREGGAIYMTNAALIINNSTFDSNTAWSLTKYTLGGAVRLNNSSGNIMDSMFSNNAALNGGALYMTGTELSLTNTIFQINEATGVGGAIAVSGVDIFAVNCIFNYNLADDSGGAINLYGSFLDAKQCDFNHNNCSGFGGAIRGLVSGGSIQATSFEENTANVGGGAVSLENSKMVFVQSSLQFNRAASGGAIRGLTSSQVFLNSTNVQFNTAVIGGALYLQYKARLYIDTVVVSSNSAVNQAPAIYCSDSQISVFNLTASGNFIGDSGGNSSMITCAYIPAGTECRVKGLDYDICNYQHSPAKSQLFTGETWQLAVIVGVPIVGCVALITCSAVLFRLVRKNRKHQKFVPVWARSLIRTPVTEEDDDGDEMFSVGSGKYGK